MSPVPKLHFGSILSLGKISSRTLIKITELFWDKNLPLNTAPYTYTQWLHCPSELLRIPKVQKG
jgi:hypothetical protein